LTIYNAENPGKILKFASVTWMLTPDMCSLRWRELSG